jgi:hypothetical protein
MDVWWSFQSETTRSEGSETNLKLHSGSTTVSRCEAWGLRSEVRPVYSHVIQRLQSKHKDVTAHEAQTCHQRRVATVDDVEELALPFVGGESCDARVLDLWRGARQQVALPRPAHV